MINIDRIQTLDLPHDSPVLHYPIRRLILDAWNKVEILRPCGKNGVRTVQVLFLSARLPSHTSLVSKMLIGDYCELRRQN